MRQDLRTTLLPVALLAAAPLAVLAAAPKAPAKGGPRVHLSTQATPVPLFSEASSSVPVAQVGSETITVRDFAQVLAEAHADHASAAGKERDFAPLLDRLISVRLITLEARAMGIDELPDVTKALAEFRTTTLRDMSRDRATRNVKADPKKVERLYREKVKQWKVQSVLFEREEEAKAFARLTLGRTAFAETSERMMKEGKARARTEGQVLERAKVQPAVLAAVQKLKPGQVSAPVHVGEGHAVLLLEEILYPDVPGARMEAEQSVSTPLRQAALRRHHDALLKKYATVDRKLLASLDYHAEKPGLAALAKDPRVLARIRGEAPITVATFTAELQKQFFHGMEQAMKEKKVNGKKNLFFDALLSRRLLERDARAHGIPESEEYKRVVAEYERSLLFGTFVERAVLPDVKVSEADARAYYDGHQAEFRYPDLYKLETLAFASASEAQAACAKLQAGTDVKWLKANADNQLPASKRSIQMDGTSVTVESMPEALAKILAGTKSGDCRIFPRAQGECYAVLVAGKTVRQVQPLAEARATIDRKLFQEKLVVAVAEWAKKLRKAYEVKVFITGLDV